MSSNGAGAKAPMKLDPITLEIIIARLQELVATMEHLLFHSGYSTILRETQDGSVTLCLGSFGKSGRTARTSAQHAQARHRRCSRRGSFIRPA